MKIKTAKEIAKLIKTNAWENVVEIDLDDYVYSPMVGEYALKTKSIIQCRAILFDESLITEAYNTARNTGEILSKRATIVYFPEEVVLDGIAIPANSFKGIGGTHGLVIDAKLGLKKKEANVLNFKHDLQSSYRKIIRIGNILNKTEERRRVVTAEDAKRDLYIMMDEIGGKPSDAEREEFLEDYDFISVETYSLWVSNHKDHGGRRPSATAFTEAERQAKHKEIAGQECYKGWWIPKPITAASAKTRIALCLLNCAIHNKRKFFQIIYPDTVAQDQSIANEELKKEVEKYLENIRDHFGDKIEAAEYTIMTRDNEITK